MSSYLKPTEVKKPKNNTFQNISNNYNSNNPSKNNKLSFSNAFKNNTHKKNNINANSAKKRHSKKHSISHNIEKENNMPNKITNNKKIDYNQENNNNINNINNSEEDINERKINHEDDEDNKRVLNNVDSYQSLGFLLPKKINLEKSAEKIVSNNRRYLNQEAYDYDGNNLYNKKLDSSGKKKYNEKEKETDSDENENDDEEKNNEVNEGNESSYNEEDLEKLKKQEELIKELMKYKNFQNFVKKILKRRKLGVDKKGKMLKWSLFRKYLYKIAFLDLYYKHRIPFIIMRPRLDVIKRKREERQRIIRERQKMEEDLRNNNSRGIGLKNSLEMKEGETTYASILDKTVQNEMEKNGYIIGEDNNTVRIEKRESLFPSKDGKPKGIFTLTKIPQKTEENSGNVRLKMAFNKAKDAARVVRRLEYSYSMRVNILLSKPIFQKNAKIIQNWYRSMKFIKINTPKILKIQAFVRGMMIRKAFREVRQIYEKDLPFIKEIDKIISRRYAKIFFDKLIPRFGIRTLIKLSKIRNDKIINALSRFMKKQKYIRETFSLSTKINKKCCYTKETYDYNTKIKLLKLQSHFKSYLMHNNEKTLLKYTNEYHPKLYYYLKYLKDKDLLKKKLRKFRECFLKMKELKLKIKYKGKNINNKYDYFKYLIRKLTFNKLKSYYYDSVNNKDINYQKKMKLKILLNHQKINNNRRILKRYLNKWNIYANYLNEYRRILKNDKLLLIEAILKYHKKFREKIFLLLLNSIRENKDKEEKKAVNKMISFYNKYNKLHDKQYVNNILLRAIKIWKKKSKLISLLKASNTINKNAKIYLNNKKLKQKQKLTNCLNIRNKIFKEKLRLWKFNAGKLKHHYHSFINKTLGIIKMRKKINILRKNLTSLEKRKKNILRKYFDRFQTNTGVKKLLYINLQMCLYDENKKPIIDDKYSVMKYIKDENNVNKDELKTEITLQAIYNFYKSKQKMSEFKKKCGRRIRMKCEFDKNILKLKFIHWYKINKIKKAENACKIIQRQFRKYKKIQVKN